MDLTTEHKETISSWLVECMQLFIQKLHDTQDDRWWLIKRTNKSIKKHPDAVYVWDCFGPELANIETQDLIMNCIGSHKTWRPKLEKQLGVQGIAFHQIGNAWCMKRGADGGVTSDQLATRLVRIQVPPFPTMSTDTEQHEEPSIQQITQELEITDFLSTKRQLQPPEHPSPDRGLQTNPLKKPNLQATPQHMKQQLDPPKGFRWAEYDNKHCRLVDGKIAINGCYHNKLILQRDYNEYQREHFIVEALVFCLIQLQELNVYFHLKL